MKYNMNKRLKVILIACFSMFLFVNKIIAQEHWIDLVEQLVDNDETNKFQLENFIEDLTYLKEHPIPINSATKEQLESLPFLSDELIENIFYYLYKHGSMLSEKELMMVKGMDRQTARCLKCFITFQQFEKEKHKLNLNDILKYGKHELLTRIDIPFYTKNGYKNHLNKSYLGSSYYHNFRYSFRYSDKVYFGLTAEKDAGEPFFKNENKKGYDYYSPYLLIKNVGRIKSLALGNYRLNYGYGLVINTNFTLGKSTTFSSLGNQIFGIKKHSSTDEYNYFQGIAGSIYITNRFTIDAFYSYRTMDGIVDNGFITSIKNDGLHRVSNDFKKKNTFSNQLIGSNIHFNGKNLKIGLTGVYNVFNKMLNTTFHIYNKYYPRGKDFFNIGLNYKIFWKQFILSGETAFDKKGKIAMINMIRYSPGGNFQLVVMNRFYDVAYQSLYANAVKEGTLVQNESGIYMGLETYFLRYFKLSLYGDYFYFPWKKYQLSKNGTQGFEGIIQINYSPRYELDMFIKYRYKNKYKDLTLENKEKITIPYIQQKWKYQLNYSPINKLKFKTSIDIVHNNYQNNKASNGIMIGQSIDYKFRNVPLQLNGSMAWFHTDDYLSRISMYEKGLLYTFSIPSFYGKGERLTFNIRYEYNKHFIFQAKYALTHYRNRDYINSGLEQINGNMKNDLYLQLIWKFGN